MSRAKWSTVTRRRHKKVMKAVKGHRAARSRTYKAASESLLHAQDYATRHRRLKKRQMRSLAILRLNAAAHQQGTTYSQLISGMRKASIELDRMALANLAANDPDAFKAVVDQAAAAA